MERTIKAQWSRVEDHLARNKLKRLVDLTGSLTLIGISSPLLLLIAWMIRRDGGSSIYHQERIGYGGKTFKCYKFRSMIMNAQEVLEELLANDPEARKEWEKDFKLKEDPRITRVGHFLRKTSLDELPQLFNVVKGEMSLVGPRPIVADEVNRYGSSLGQYLSTRPGMTGLWQVSGRNDVTYSKRISLDCDYVENWKLYKDFHILLKTINVVLLRKGAY